MQKLIQKITVTTFTLLLIFGVILIATDTHVSAQGVLVPSGETEETDDDEDDEDETDLDLSDDHENLPVPVLFGVSVDDIYPSFGDPRDGGSRSHEGLDLLAPEGTPIVSLTDAEVERIGSFSGAGNYVITETENDERFYYYHLEDQADYLDRGDDIEAGDLIGFVGSTGNAHESAPHLHLEIHEDRDPQDPYPRITRDFSLAEKMRILENVFDDADDEEELAEFLVREFRGAFREAVRQGLDIPEPVLDELPADFNEVSTVPQRDLTVGAEGGDVRILQQTLIDSGHLQISSPTGYFGPLTESALASYQESSGIEPASGYYGPITRSHLQGSTGSQASETQTQVELLERIDELREQAQTLQAQLES